METNLKPDQTVPISSQHEIIGPSEDKTSEEIKGVKGKTIPPIPKAGSNYKLVDKTRH